MKPRPQTDDAKRLSDLIGAIYDCAIDPGRWEATLGDIRDFLDCHNGMLYLFDPANSAARISVMVGIESRWQAKMLGYLDSVVELYNSVSDFDRHPIDKAAVVRRKVPDEVLEANRYFTEWARPQGIDDMIQVTLLRERTRMSLFSLGRHASAGYITDREVRLIELLAPHLRRAVAISDLIDMKTIEAEALGGTLDSMAVGIVLVGAGGAVLHANRAATRLFEDGTVLELVGGKLCVTDRTKNERLMNAIADAADNRAEAGNNGLGVALTQSPAPACVAHVLPVTGGEVRARLAPGAVAAIFISSAGDNPQADLQPIAEAFGLTPAETRLLEHIVAGQSIAEASLALNVARTTSKTHLSRILAKTGTRRQPALLALVHRLAPGLQSGRPSPRA